MNRRFFSETSINGDSVTLADSEAHHLLHVLRAKVGDSVILFDGSGYEFSAEIATLSRRDVVLNVLDRQFVDRESARRVTMALTLPKGDRQKTLVEKCVELGVHTLVPLRTEFSLAAPKSTARKKLERAVVEASKQCGRNRLMKIESPQSFEEYVQTPHPAALCLLAHPYHSTPFDEALTGVDASQPMVVAVGPEGGFSSNEVAAAIAANWKSVQLGPRILRIETAAIALAARLIC